MKNFLGISIIILVLAGLTSCSDKIQRKADSMYLETSDNPALGSPSSMGAITPPISDNIGTSAHLFKKTHEETTETNPIAITQEVEEKEVPKLSASPEIVAEEPELVRAPRIPADKIYIDEPAEEKAAPEKEITELPKLHKPASLVYKMNKEMYVKDVPAEAETDVAAEETAPAETTEASDELPPVDSAMVGQCVAKATVFGEYKEVEENILVKEASHKTIQVPAEYKDVEEEIVIKESSTKLVEIPATYKTIEEIVVITPETTEEVIISPAKYDEVTEKILVHPARKVWKEVGKNGVMKLVEEPEEYRNETKQVLIEEEKRETRTIPAVTKTVTKQVVDTEARVEQQVIPAKTKKIKKQILVNDATSKTIEIPAEYRVEKKKIAVTPDKQQWMPVVCGDELGKDTVKRLQGALVAKGYDLSSVDGVIGNNTQKAVDEFQATLGFSVKGVSLQTLGSLGIEK